MADVIMKAADKDGDHSCSFYDQSLSQSSLPSLFPGAARWSPEFHSHRVLVSVSCEQRTPPLNPCSLWLREPLRVPVGGGSSLVPLGTARPGVLSARPPSSSCFSRAAGGFLFVSTPAAVQSVLLSAARRQWLRRPRLWSCAVCRTARALMLIAAPRTSCASSALGSLAHWPRPGCWCQIQTTTQRCVCLTTCSKASSRALSARAPSRTPCASARTGRTVDCLGAGRDARLASADRSIFDLRAHSSCSSTRCRTRPTAWITQSSIGLRRPSTSAAGLDQLLRLPRRD